MTELMHIGLVGPVATADIAHLLDGGTAKLPRGYSGAPLLATLITEFVRRGHRVSAFTLSNDLSGRDDATVVASGPNFSMHYCAMRPRAWRPNGWQPGRIVDLYRVERRALQQAINRANPDVIHAHWAYEFALAALASKIPHVVTCHDAPYAIARMETRSRPTRSGYRWLRVLMAKKALREARCVTAVSPYMRDAVQAMTTARIEVVPNPVDDRALELARPRAASTAPRVIMVCNGWSAWKNPQPALLAFAALRRTNPGATLHMYGCDFGPGETAQSWCRAQNIDDGMVFHGAVTHYQLLSAMAQCDLLLHPSLEESFGLVIAEAMAMGLPVVAGQSSGAVPWVVGTHGTLCDVRDAGAIELAMAATLDGARYAQFSREGIAAAKERFSTTLVVDHFQSLYQSACTEQIQYVAHGGEPRGAT